MSIAVGTNVDYSIEFNTKENKKLNKLFLTIQVKLILISNLIDIYIYLPNY